MRGHSRQIRSVAFSPDSKYLVSGSHDKKVKLWSIECKKEVVTSLQEHSDCVTSVAFSADGRFIASCSRDKTIKLWDVDL